jgi:serpin B
MFMVYGLSWAAAVDEPAAEKRAMQVPRGNTAFALDLYAKLRGAEGNVFVSPLSISTALGMTYAGAEGETAKQMSQVLHLPEDKAKASAELGALLKALEALGKEKGCELSIANSLWGQTGYPFRPDFLAGIKENYGAGLEQVDFARQTEAARLAINAWVEKKTKDRIKELIREGLLTPVTRLVLVNAVYFKGDWKMPFKEERTKDAPFRASADRTVTVSMMNQEDNFGYMASEDFQALELPYAGDALSMVVFLPKKADGLDAFEKTLTPENLDKWLKSRRMQEVQVFLPRFTMTILYQDLAETLAEMGMPLAFDDTKADFSGMTTVERLWISAVIHKAFIDVNEKGTEAAAATAVITPGESMPAPPPVFRADHPFFFLIRDTKTGSILFMGRVVNPKE